MTKETAGLFRELKPGSFVYALEQALDPEICRDIIYRFEANPEQQYPGRIGQVGELEQGIKQSTDLRVSGRDEWKDIDEALRQSLSLGLSLVAGLHPFFMHNRLQDTGYNLQKTGPGEFYHWHVDGGPGKFSKRQMVAIWYLNEFPQPGGETEFHFQSLSISPRTGMLILFPPFWTHLHRGSTVVSGTKYIATTWVCTD